MFLHSRGLGLRRTEYAGDPCTDHSRMHAQKRGVESNESEDATVEELLAAGAVGRKQNHLSTQNTSKTVAHQDDIGRHRLVRHKPAEVNSVLVCPSTTHHALKSSRAYEIFRRDLYRG